ncbi:antirestriction protein ArdA [uncultured Desulfovibrio sp.]|uniref:antirestriction protein ArdA n=1 Tax=uncultured Desulfovibrio sp. TaxID=167968 RepID=UPI0025FE1474|nr:antirestriction protein ArdA [uncultured Desulfovibrio sp.]
MSTEHNRIYVASLSDYNGGILHGVWLTLDNFSSVDEIWEAINSMLATSPTAKATGLPSEEIAIHDYEGFYGLRIGEQDSISNIWEAHELLESLDDPEAFAEWLWHERSTDISEVTEEAMETFQDAFCGRYESEEAYAEELINGMGILDHADELLSRYFDYEAFARDLFMPDYFMTDNGYVFCHC